MSLIGAGTRTTGVVSCDQPRALDLSARKGKKLETVSAAIIEDVLGKLEHPSPHFLGETLHVDLKSSPNTWRVAVEKTSEGNAQSRGDSQNS